MPPGHETKKHSKSLNTFCIIKSENNQFLSRLWSCFWLRVIRFLQITYGIKEVNWINPDIDSSKLGWKLLMHNKGWEILVSHFGHDFLNEKQVTWKIFIPETIWVSQAFRLHIRHVIQLMSQDVLASDYQNYHVILSLIFGLIQLSMDCFNLMVSDMPTVHLTMDKFSYTSN